MYNNIIIANELHKDQEINTSVKLLQEYYNIADKDVYQYETIEKYYAVIKQYDNINIIFVGHNSHLSNYMSGTIKREEVIQKLANIQQIKKQLEMNIEFFSCHMYKSLEKMKFDFLKKATHFNAIELKLNLYASLYYLKDNTFYTTLKNATIAKTLFKEKKEYFVDEIDKINEKTMQDYELLLKPIIPVFEPIYKNNICIKKRFTFPEGYLNKKDNLQYITKEELEITKDNFIERIVVNRTKKNFDIFEEKLIVNY